jgi:DNA-binding transcriptional regulator LsrR (DeoR family)
MEATVFGRKWRCMMDRGIVVVTVQEKNEKTGQMEPLVSHGYCLETGHVVPLQQDRPERIGAKWNAALQEFVLEAS